MAVCRTWSRSQAVGSVLTSGTTFGRDAFQAQAEGVMLRTCGKDGWWITTEQGKQRSVFHLFDRRSLAHRSWLGSAENLTRLGLGNGKAKAGKR